MIGLDMQCPVSCKECRFKGARWCYIEIWSNRGAKEVPEKGRPEWCPLIDLGASEDEKVRAWEPLEPPKEGTCGTCTHIDWTCAYPTCPMKYKCLITGDMHFLTDECDAEIEE